MWHNEIVTEFRHSCIECPPPQISYHMPARTNPAPNQKPIMVHFIKRKGIVGGLTDKQAYLFLCIILVFAAVLAGLLFKGMSLYGDDSNYAVLLSGIIHGTFKETADIFSVRTLFIFPFALFVKIFGFTDMGAGAYSYVCYLITVIAVFFIGKEMSGNRVGLLSSFLFSIYPLILKYSSLPNGFMSLGMYLTLSALFFVIAKKEDRPAMYLLAGLFTFLGTLIDPLSYLYFLFFTFYAIAKTLMNLRGKNLARSYVPLLYLLGFATGLFAYGFVNVWLSSTGQPFYQIALTDHYYSSTGGVNNTIYYTNPDLTYYLSVFFPYQYPSGPGSIYMLYGEMFNINKINFNVVGLFSYFVILFGIYLLFKRESGSYFAMGWASFVMLYMEFGTMSLKHYEPIYKLSEFTILVTVPIVLIIAAGLDNIYRSVSVRHKTAATFIVLMVIAFLFATTITLDYAYWLYNYETTLYLKFIAGYLKTVPDLQNVSIYGSSLTQWYVYYYMGEPTVKTVNLYSSEYSIKHAYGGVYMPNCKDIPNNTYLIIPPPFVINEINGIGLWTISENWSYNPALCNLKLVANLYNDSATIHPGMNNSGTVLWVYTGNLYYKNNKG